VGAGPAGSTAAYILAENGVDVLLVERGSEAGAKNMSGGILYSQIANIAFPDFWKEAPIERPITCYNTVLLDRKASVNISLDAPRLSRAPYNAFSVLRAKLDKWMAGKAEAAGATLITDTTVDELIVDKGRVAGIRSGSDELYSDVVIDAEGARSMLLKEAGFRGEIDPKDVSIGVKELIKLPEDTINQRFNIHKNEGSVYTLVGNTRGISGGGFMVTNSSSVSLGFVLSMNSLIDKQLKISEMIEEYRSHPFISKLVEDGEIIEYSAGLVHEGGYEKIPKLYGDGLLVCGSAAGLNLNNFFNLRGMDLAILSGEAAARTAIKAINEKDTSASSLRQYEANLNSRHVLDEMENFRRVPFLFGNQRLFAAYPRLVCNTFEELYEVTPNPSRKLRDIVMNEINENVGVTELLLDFVEVYRSL
jgi:electron transfer flavoprotein-quinone oxidoreductase